MSRIGCPAVSSVESYQRVRLETDFLHDLIISVTGRKPEICSIQPQIRHSVKKLFLFMFEV